MTSLLEEIRSISKDAARALECAGCFTDSEIKSLSRIDLNELLPGPEKLQVRKKVFEKIQNTTKKPIDVILNEPKSFSPDEAFREALTDNGAAVDCLNTLKELKGHVNQIQMFIDSRISRLERYENQDQELINKRCILDKHHQTSGNVQTLTQVTVMHQTIVTGKTLNAHQGVLKQVKEQFVQGEDSFQLQLDEKGVDHCKIIIVFCPVVSRIGTDVESAMRLVPDDKDIILVLMHHAREAKTSSSLRTWSRPQHVVLDVSVFFHDAVGGLLNCKENDDAVSEIQRKLLDYSSNRVKIQTSPNVSSTSPFSFFGKLFPNQANK